MSALVSGCSGSPAYVGEWLAMLFDITCFSSEVVIEKERELCVAEMGGEVTWLFTVVDGTFQVKPG